MAIADHRVINMSDELDKRRTKRDTTDDNGKRRSRVAEHRPLAVTVDIAQELEDNRDTYTGDGDAWFTIYALPSYLLTSLDRIRRRVPGTNMPGINPTAACAIVHGIRTIQSHDDVRALLKLKEQLYKSDGAGSADRYEAVAQWFRSYPFGVMDGAMSGTERRNISLPKHVKLDLNEFASELGTTGSALAVLCITASLANQPAVMRDHSRLMAVAVTAFLRRTYERRRIAELLLELLEE